MKILSIAILVMIVLLSSEAFKARTKMNTAVKLTQTPTTQSCHTVDSYYDISNKSPEEMRVYLNTVDFSSSNCYVGYGDSYYCHNTAMDADF